MPQYTLEERECKCGCGSKWKALPSSTQWYAKATHDPEFEQRNKVSVDARQFGRVRAWLRREFPDDTEDLNPILEPEADDEA